MLVSKNQLILKQAFKHVTAGIGYFYIVKLEEEKS